MVRGEHQILYSSTGNPSLVYRYHVHDIDLTLTSNWPRFLELVAFNFRAFPPGEEARDSLNVDVTLRKKRWFRPPRAPDAPLGGEEKWGTDLYLEGDAVRFRMENEGVEFVDGTPVTVRAWYTMDRRSRVASLYRDVPPWEVCHRLMRRAIHQPLLSLLERRNLLLFHAAAAALRGEAVLIIGLNGSGKSSLCFSLLDEFDYMSDNYVFWDGQEVLGFPEALRLAVWAGPEADDAPMVFGKHLIPVDREKVTWRATPRAAVLVTQASETRMVSLSPETAAQRIRTIHDMTHEFPRHLYLGPLSPPRDPSRLEAFTRAVPTYALRVSEPATARALLRELF